MVRKGGKEERKRDICRYLYKSFQKYIFPEYTHNAHPAATSSSSSPLPLPSASTVGVSVATNVVEVVMAFSFGG